MAENKKQQQAESVQGQNEQRQNGQRQNGQKQNRQRQNGQRQNRQRQNGQRQNRQSQNGQRQNRQRQNEQKQPAFRQEGDNETGLKNGMTQEEYKEYVKQITPVNNTVANVLHAFLVGGAICVIGQCINNWLTGSINLGKEDAASWTSIILVCISVLLTGFNIYSKIVKWGGAGALVPITGFANSVASPAIEAQTEGQVFGIGCSIFKIAGPVILYGIFSSWVLGIIYWIGKMMGIV